jgi:1-acyl-sn-glycerol-3-phosphate acyltransferase
VIGIFPEGTINRTDDIIMPFKIGAVKMAKETNTKIVPFVITGEYKAFKKNIAIEFLKPIEIKSDNLTKENEKLMKIISKKLEEKRK